MIATIYICLYETNMKRLKCRTEFTEIHFFMKIVFYLIPSQNRSLVFLANLVCFLAPKTGSE